MGMTSDMPREIHGPSSGKLLKQSSTGGAIEVINSLVTTASSGSNLRDGDCACDLSLVSDDNLITAAQSGDQQAFVELCRRHSPVTKNRIFRIVRNHEDAEDALQDTLLRAYTHLTSFRRSCKFSTWLTTIGVNSALMLVRKRKSRREAHGGASGLDTGTVELPEFADRSLGPEGIYLKHQAILLVRREVEKLQPSLRSLVNGYYGSECSLEEAAKAQEISLGAAKSRLLRGRVRLRSSLARYGLSKSDHCVPSGR